MSSRIEVEEYFASQLADYQSGMTEWTHVPAQIGSLTSAALGKTARFLVDPILDRQKLKFLEPILAHTRRLETEEEWKVEMEMRLSRSEDKTTEQVLETLRCAGCPY